MPRSDSNPRGSSQLAIAAIVVSSAIYGCSGSVGPRSDAVARASAMQQLRDENDALRSELKSYRERDEASDRAVDAAVLPKPASLTEARGSAVRVGADGGSLQWRIRSEDRRGRMVQTTGPARVMAACFDRDGSLVDLGRWEISSDAWSRSLREGMLGGSYAIDVPLDGTLPDGVGVVQVRIELEDPRCVGSLELDSLVPVIRDSASEDPS